MPSHVECQVLVYSAFSRNLFQQDIRPAVSIKIKQAVPSAERFVTVNDFAGTLHQLYTEWNISFLSHR